MTAREVVKRYVLGDCALWDACQQGLCACGCEHRADAIRASGADGGFTACRDAAGMLERNPPAIGEAARILTAALEQEGGP